MNIVDLSSGASRPLGNYIFHVVPETAGGTRETKRVGEKMAAGGRPRISKEILLEAVRKVIANNGIEGLRVRRIASAAGVSPGSVLYHYPDQSEMIIALHRDLVEDYLRVREGAVNAVEGPAHRLITCAALGLPPFVDTSLVGPLFELHTLARRDAQHAELMTMLWRRESALYESIITAGLSQGEFKSPRSPSDLAETFLALEDGLALHIVNNNDSLAGSQALLLLAEVAGRELGNPRLLDLAHERSAFAV